MLREGEVLLEFLVARGVSLLYVVERDGAVLAIELPDASAAVEAMTTSAAARAARKLLARGRDPDGQREAGDLAGRSRELFASLVPRSVWERIRGTKRAEAQAIGAAFHGKGRKNALLLGAEAIESAVFDLAKQAKYLHFACHGIAEEYAGQSLSMLVLAQPQHVLPADDGLLRFSDLSSTWRGRLSSCRLVVLSACRTNVGPTFRDEAPQALPIGFLFAGVPSVISSLWAVDDVSTRELMVNFYGRLLAGETDQLAAFTAAKKDLKKKYPDPFHWAPFLYMGSP